VVVTVDFTHNAIAVAVTIAIAVPVGAHVTGFTLVTIVVFLGRLAAAFGS